MDRSIVRNVNYLKYSYAIFSAYNLILNHILFEMDHVTKMKARPTHLYGADSDKL